MTETELLILETLRLLLVCQQSDRAMELSDYVDEHIARIDRVRYLEQASPAVAE
jgi:hypothetical protein